MVSGRTPRLHGPNYCLILYLTASSLASVSLGAQVPCTSSQLFPLRKEVSVLAIPERSRSQSKSLKPTTLVNSLPQWGSWDIRWYRVPPEGSRPSIYFGQRWLRSHPASAWAAHPQLLHSLTSTTCLGGHMVVSLFSSVLRVQWCNGVPA